MRVRIARTWQAVTWAHGMAVVVVWQESGRQGSWPGVQDVEDSVVERTRRQPESRLEQDGSARLELLLARGWYNVIRIGADFPGAVGANAPSKKVWWVRRTQ